MFSCKQEYEQEILALRKQASAEADAVSLLQRAIYSIHAHAYYK